MAEAPRNAPWRRTVRAWRRMARILADPVPRFAADLTRAEEIVSRLSWELPLLEVDPFAFAVDDASGRRSSPDRDARLRREVPGRLRRTPSPGTAPPLPAARPGGGEAPASSAGGSRSPAVPARADVPVTASRAPRSSPVPATESVVAADTGSRAENGSTRSSSAFSKLGADPVPTSGEAVGGENEDAPGPLAAREMERMGGWEGAAGRGGRGVRDLGGGPGERVREGAPEAPGREGGEKSDGKSVLASLIDSLLEPKPPAPLEKHPLEARSSDSGQASFPRQPLRPAATSEPPRRSDETRVPGRASGTDGSGSPPAAGAGRPAEPATAGVRTASAQSPKASLPHTFSRTPSQTPHPSIPSPYPHTPPPGRGDAPSHAPEPGGRLRLAQGVSPRSDSVQLPANELDARHLASLINDILVEEARRHGVDLS